MLSVRIYLDSVLGYNRNGDYPAYFRGKRADEVDFNDPSLCPLYLEGICCPEYACRRQHNDRARGAFGRATPDEQRRVRDACLHRLRDIMTRRDRTIAENDARSRPAASASALHECRKAIQNRDFMLREAARFVPPSGALPADGDPDGSLRHLLQALDQAERDQSRAFSQLATVTSAGGAGAGTVGTGEAGVHACRECGGGLGRQESDSQLVRHMLGGYHCSFRKAMNDIVRLEIANEASRPAPALPIADTGPAPVLSGPRAAAYAHPAAQTWRALREVVSSTFTHARRAPADAALTRAAAAFAAPRPVQVVGAVGVLAGQDIVINAATGAGKTLLYVLAVVSAALSWTPPPVPRPSPAAVVVVPSRELAAQVVALVREVAKDLDHDAVCDVYSSIPADTCRVLVAAPGKLFDHLRKGVISNSQCTLVVVDEADRFLTDGGNVQAQFWGSLAVFVPAAAPVLDALLQPSVAGAGVPRAPATPAAALVAGVRVPEDERNGLIDIKDRYLSVPALLPAAEIAAAPAPAVVANGDSEDSEDSPFTRAPARAPTAPAPAAVAPATVTRATTAPQLILATATATASLAAMRAVLAPSALRVMPPPASGSVPANLTHFVGTAPTPHGGMRRIISLLLRAAPSSADRKTIVFVPTRVMVETVAQELMRSRSYERPGDVFPFHAGRDRDAPSFAASVSRASIIVTTSALARGFDVPSVQTVYCVACDEPSVFTDLYLHRIGRAGRDGSAATAYTIVTNLALRDLARAQKARDI